MNERLENFIFMRMFIKDNQVSLKRIVVSGAIYITIVVIEIIYMWPK